MLKKLVIFSSIFVILSAGAITVSAQWVDLGTREVKDRSEQDTWHVGKGQGEFRRLKLRVLDRAVRFYRVRVTFENGQSQEIQVKKLIAAGGETRAWDLSGGHRFIDKVDIWYEASTAGQGVRSHVTLWGIR